MGWSETHRATRKLSSTWLRRKSIVVPSLDRAWLCGSRTHLRTPASHFQAEMFLILGAKLPRKDLRRCLQESPTVVCPLPRGGGGAPNKTNVALHKEVGAAGEGRLLPSPDNAESKETLHFLYS